MQFTVGKQRCIPWTHLVSEANYHEADGYRVYRYYDTRFNRSDWYDVWMLDTRSGADSGWNRLIEVYDGDYDIFFYRINVYKGFVEFPVYGDELSGKSLKFFRLRTE